MNVRIGYSVFRLRAHLKRGGVIAYPTESSYGLGCLPNHAVGIRRIIQLKKRPQNKGLIVIGDGWGRLQSLLFRLPEGDAAACLAIWQVAPPTTLLLPARDGVLPALRGIRRDKLAVRVPQHVLARRLCAGVGSALVSTSCNRAKKRPCRTERETRRQFGRDVLVIGGRTGGRKQPSRIIDWQSAQQLR